ncbi:hypothetical protein K503DRAFT_338428 [Rhizopogon vinicolor AM-OR11-026]|uniref:Uncharacterized protein n=1 Tax=Rhizopogon vinicolor AM-OR11-026 TaxID=1314800 RepID=A0A1B7MTK8_9AGAM|nr:hypothetical protein K503DRAFT_338428 [Rhizopogon vinicolor AM-OR11-026]
MDPFSDMTLAAFQRIALPLFNPLQLGTYIHKNQQLQALRDHCEALEMQMVKITTERDTIIEFPAACKCCMPSRPAAPSESSLSAVLSQLPVLGSPPITSSVLRLPRPAPPLPMSPSSVIGEEHPVTSLRPQQLDL